MPKAIWMGTCTFYRIALHGVDGMVMMLHSIGSILSVSIEDRKLVQVTV